MNLGRVLELMRQVWPAGAGRSAVMAGYRALGTQHHHTLADFGHRNFLFSSLPDGDALAMARAAGRQDAARELFELAKVDPALIHARLERKPQENRT